MSELARSFITAGFSGVKTVLSSGNVILPVGAAFRDGESGAVLVVSGERARKRTVTLGEKSDSEVEIREGLAPADSVSLYPGDQVHDGQRVKAR